METIIITLDNNKKKEYVKGIKLKEIIEQEKDKLTKYKDLCIQGKMTAIIVLQCYLSWRGVYNKFDSKDLERLKKHFEKVMSFIIIQLGTDAFAKYKVENEKLKLQSHFNAAVYDAISIAISDKIMEDETFTITTQMKQRLKQLFFNDDFIDSINGSTNDKSKILKRIKIVKGVLK